LHEKTDIVIKHISHEALSKDEKTAVDMFILGGQLLPAVSSSSSSSDQVPC
jgi:regulator of RNase E activity RraB